MFRLYDQTRRRLCLAAFCLLCIAPTVCVVGWCIAWQLPGTLRAESRRLGQSLGLDASLEGLRHLRPGVVLYEGLKLSDPETGQPVFRCNSLEVTRTEVTDAEGRRRPAFVLAASQPEFEAAAADRLGQLLHGTLTAQNSQPETEFRWTAGELTVRAGEGPLTLSAVEGAVEFLPGGLQARTAFRLPGDKTAQPVRLRVTRNRQISPPASGLELDTGGSELPCSLMGLVVPEVRALGPASRFRGHLVAVQSAGGWEGEVRGSLLGLDLDNLVSNHFPHRLSGHADMMIEHARFQGGRLEEATATVSAGPGVVSRSLLRAAVERLRLQPAAEPSGTGDLIRYEQLAFALSIDAQGLRLEGRAPGRPPGVLLVDASGPLLARPAAQPVPVAALVQMLVPASEVQVPAARQTEWLTRHLPVPEVVAPPGEASVPSVGLRPGRPGP
jgi:hypothetical protein